MIKAYSAWGLTLHAGVRWAAVERLHPLQADMRKCGPDAGAPPPSAFLERLMEAFHQFTPLILTVRSIRQQLLSPLSAKLAEI